MLEETSKRAILVADGDSTYARLLVELLQRHGYAALAVVGSQDARTAAAASRHDLALIDVRLRLDCGLSLGAALRDEYAMPFIILSATDDTETARLATETGALAYLLKNGHMQHYLPTIHAALARIDQLRELQQREAQLTQALNQTRAISMATGVLMARSRLNRDQAFAHMRRLARAERRPLKDVAEKCLDSLEYLNAVVAAPSGSPEKLSRS